MASGSQRSRLGGSGFVDNARREELAAIVAPVGRVRRRSAASDKAMTVGFRREAR